MTAEPATDLYQRLTQWQPAVQEAAATALEAALENDWRPFYCGDWSCDGKAHGEWRWPHARGDQHPPQDYWHTWIELSGRGAGKTRSGSEWTHRCARLVKPNRKRSTVRLALVAPTAADARDIMVEGESGLLATQRLDNPCVYEPSKRRVTWQSGARATLFSAETANRLRGPQHHFAWVDEACFMANVQEVWDNLLFGLRLGSHPRVHVTTTPRPRVWLRDLLKNDTTRVSTASTYANIDNLAPTFRKQVLDQYEGTRLGRQEIHAEILEEIEGALWTYATIDDDRVPAVSASDLDAIVVAIDPPGDETGAEAGIIVVGRRGDHAYILQDLSGRMSPSEWGTAAIAAYKRWNANAIIVETNFGGQMVPNTIRVLPDGHDVVIIGVNARQGKRLRAEPVVALYEQHRVHHVGVLAALETQQTEWVPEESPDSPDRLDAMVHGVTWLLVKAAPTQLSNPATMGRRLPGSTFRQVR